MFATPQIKGNLGAMAPVTVISHVAQQAQGAANALNASLPELASTGRAVLQELLAFLASGGQALPTTQGIASMSEIVAADLAADTAISSFSPSVSPLNTSMSVNSSQSELSSLRDNFKKGLQDSMTHVAKLPDQQHERSGRSWSIGSDSPLSALSVPGKKREPFLAL